MIVIECDMPTKCGDCPFYNDLDSLDCCILYSDGVPGRYDLDEESKPDWCELIDGNAVIEDIKKEIESCKGKFYQNEDNTCSPYMEGTLNEVLKIIDKHISGKVQE